MQLGHGLTGNVAHCDVHTSFHSHINSLPTTFLSLLFNFSSFFISAWLSWLSPACEGHKLDYGTQMVTVLSLFILTPLSSSFPHSCPGKLVLVLERPSVSWLGIMNFPSISREDAFILIRGGRRDSLWKISQVPGEPVTVSWPKAITPSFSFLPLSLCILSDSWIHRNTMLR